MWHAQQVGIVWTFKSKAVEKGVPFRAQQHIEKPMVKLVASRKYFTLTDVTYEQVTPKEKEEKGKKEDKKEDKKEEENGGSHNP